MEFETSGFEFWDLSLKFSIQNVTFTETKLIFSKQRKNINLWFLFQIRWNVLHFFNLNIIHRVRHFRFWKLKFEVDIWYSECHFYRDTLIFEHNMPKMKYVVFNFKFDERYYICEFEIYNLSSKFLLLNIEIWVWNLVFRKSLLQRHIDFWTSFGTISGLQSRATYKLSSKFLVLRIEIEI